MLLHNILRMSDKQTVVSRRRVAADTSEKVFYALSAGIRRDLLFHLALQGGQTGNQLKEVIRQKLENTIVHLKFLVDAGMLESTSDPADGRRRLYKIAPSLAVHITDDYCTINFLDVSIRRRLEPIS